MVENHLRSALQRREFLHSAELVLGRDHAAGSLSQGTNALLNRYADIDNHSRRVQIRVPNEVEVSI